MDLLRKAKAFGDKHRAQRKEDQQKSNNMPSSSKDNGPEPKSKREEVKGGDAKAASSLTEPKKLAGPIELEGDSPNTGSDPQMISFPTPQFTQDPDVSKTTKK